MLVKLLAEFHFLCSVVEKLQINPMISISTIEFWTNKLFQLSISALTSGILICFVDLRLVRQTGGEEMTFVFYFVTALLCQLHKYFEGIFTVSPLKDPHEHPKNAHLWLVLVIVSFPLIQLASEGTISFGTLRQIAIICLIEYPSTVYMVGKAA